MIRTAFALALVLAFVLAFGCTSFSFKKGGKGSAPAELMDRAGMVTVPGGTFDMGAASADPDEYPPHKVSLNTFLMDRTEVTVGDFQRCVEAKVCGTPGLDEDARAWEITDRHAVVGVSWPNAKKYCEWVGKRLPTEAEWERAARHPKYSAYPFPGKFDAMKVNLRGSQDGFANTAPVGSFPAGASGLGLLDMAGNAAEWCADWYDSTYYQKSLENNPKGPEASTGSRAVRGGSWSDADFSARTTKRQGVEPNVSDDGVGFRCAANP